MREERKVKVVRRRASSDEISKQLIKEEQKCNDQLINSLKLKKKQDSLNKELPNRP